MNKIEIVSSLESVLNALTVLKDESSAIYELKELINKLNERN